MRVLGVDGCRDGWLGVLLENGHYAGAQRAKAIRELLETSADVKTIAVDIPIGLPWKGIRKADEEAKRLLGRRQSAVFYAAPRAAFLAPKHAEAVQVCRRLDAPGISQQAYALRRKILEVEEVALEDERVVEVHPEVSFLGLTGRVLASKKTWDGLRARLRALAVVGIKLPDELENGAGSTAPDDVLDAAAAGWSANRFARGVAASLPDPPERIGRSRVAIWY